ncbi:BTB-domain-containing protein [Gigaspora margarita]|uniref:BTB-domain-containing protein n=1 Tax=Gigaspora margarita TaxID=4874 RepID=A0A8H3X6D4_GIGMA|nr:BTB-domain-containing protein [Gigaspora margarita]
MSLSFHSRLSDNFGTLLEQAEDYDVMIKVGKLKTENKHFRAHSVILRARSEYFRAALSNKWAKKEGSKYVFEKPNIRPIVFEVILRYIYSGNIVLDKLSGKDIVELLVAADELIFEELIYPLQDYLLKNKLVWIQENILYVLNTVIGLSACNQLRFHCISIVCPDPVKFFESREFIELDEATLISLLNRDDLCMEEGKIWDLVLRWGLINTPNLKNLDIVNWGTKEFNALEKTLQRCIPLIRFGQLSIEEFNTKVKPYIRILPSNLRSRVVQHLLSKRQSETIVTIPTTPERAIDSIIITHQQAALIACWIDRKQVTESTSLSEMVPIPYYFRLLFRGSRDGYFAKTFHTQCDGQGATIVVVRVSKSDELIGGYNPIGWSSPRDVEWRGTRDSFIFSLGDGKELSKAKISRIKEDYVNDAIQLHDRLGPSFGFYELKIVDDAARAETSYASGGLKYEHTIRDKWNYFRVDDYEVFQVLKK